MNDSPSHSLFVNMSPLGQEGAAGKDLSSRKLRNRKEWIYSLLFYIFRLR